MAREKTGLYAAVMPDVYGHGIMRFSLVSEQDAIDRVQETYEAQFISQNRGKTPREIGVSFAERFEYYGGYTSEIDINKSYDENLR